MQLKNKIIPEVEQTCLRRQGSLRDRLKLPDKIPSKLLEFWDWGKRKLRKLDLKNKTKENNKMIVTKTKTEYINKQKKILKIFFSAKTLKNISVSVFISIFILGQLFTPSVAEAYTYNFTQSSWAGGVTANGGTHPTNATNWTEYSAKDSTVSALAGGVSLTSASSASVMDSGVPQGTLAALSPATIAGATFGYSRNITISPDGTSAYAPNYLVANVSMYSRNTSTGVLTSLGTILAGTYAAAVTISADGTSVYVANGGDSTISMYSRNTSTGLLTALSPATIVSGSTPRGITISADGTSVYVSNNGGNTISEYSRNTSTGILTALGSPNATIAAGTNPFGITISADGTSVYVANYGSNTVSEYSRNTSTGVLTALGSPNATIGTGTNPQNITLSADGASVYVSNNGGNTISEYSRNTSTGVLTALGSPNATISTGTNPYSITISANGTSVYVANYGSANVSMYSRNTSTGALTALSPNATIAAGTNPCGITISADGTSVYVANYGDGTFSMYSRANGGPGFGAGTLSSTAISGSGAAATVGLGTAAITATNFAYTGAVQTFTVPAGVTSITITGNGAGGGGAGGSSTGTLSVTPGATYYILVGGTGGYGGGGAGTAGAGGGMTWFSTASTFAQGTVLLVAGGGGGYGGGGAGGGTTGGAGSGGGGGTQSAGGAAGSSGGAAGVAGAGASGGGGGGGGGYYGGGSGGSIYYYDFGGFYFYYSGGGGSGYIKSNLTNASTTAGAGGASGANGSLTITYAASNTTNISYSGAVASYTVPAGAGFITMTANGAGGGNGHGFTTGTGGAGGSSTGTLVVTPGTTYYVLVGGGGLGSGSTGGYGGGGNGQNSSNNYGGGGGGMTWFSTQNTFTQGTVILVAGGGGGSGNQNDRLGGAGGGSTGTSGGNSSVTFGTGGTQSAGGSGRNTGTAGVGAAAVYVGGGGGGGYFGGGSGDSGGGGGGGSGYLKNTLTSTSTTAGAGAAGSSTGDGTNGSATITASGYNSSGTFTSGVIDTGASSAFSTLAYSATLNSQTLTINARAGNIATPDGTWSAWTGTIASGGNISTLSGNRYIQYRANLSTTDPSVTPTLSSVTINYSQYNTSGTLTSSIYDSSSDGNVVGNMSWVASNTSATETVKFQVRAASSAQNISSAAWCGPADTTSPCSGTSYFTVNTGTTIPAGSPLLSANRYFQYKMFLASGGAATPTVTSATVQYVVNAPPTFDATYGTNGISASQVTTPTDLYYGGIPISYKVLDSDAMTTGGFLSQITPSFQYNIGAGWVAIPSGNLLAGDTSPKDVSTGTYNTYTAHWTPTATIPNTYNATAQVRVTADDLQGANRTATATSATFALDTKVPVVSATVNSSATTSTINLTTTDDSQSQYAICNDNSFPATDTQGNSCAWSTLGSNLVNSAVTTTWVPLKDAGGNQHVYIKVRDAVGNVTSTNVTAPATPLNFQVKDITNLPAGVYGEALSFTKVTDVSGSTAVSYEIWRSTDGATATLLTTLASTVNTYSDLTVLNNHTYTYTVRTLDTDGDSSAFSTTQNVTPSGTAVTTVTHGTPTSTGVTITWSTDLLSNSVVEYGLTNTYGSSQPGTDGNTKTHTVTLTGLTPATPYFFRVKSTDGNGNTTTNDNGGAGYTFMTSTAYDITATTDGNGIITPEGTTAVQSGTDQTYTITPNTGYIVGTLTVDGALVTADTSYTFPNVTTTHTIAVTFTLNTISITATAGENGTIEPAAGVTEVTYGQDQMYTFTPADKYKISSIVVDGTSLAIAPSYTFTTVIASHTLAVTFAPLDTLPPIITLVGDSVINLDSGTEYVELGATAMDAVSLEPVEVVTTGTVDITTGGSYTITYTATDTNGNVATAMRTVNVADVTPPVITLPEQPSIIVPTQAVITWTTNEDATGQVTYGKTSCLEPGATCTQTQKIDIPASWHLVVLSDLEPRTTYYYSVTSIDHANNSATSLEQTFITVAKAGNAGTTGVAQDIYDALLAQNKAYQSKFGSDTSLPTVSNVQVTNVTPFNATVSFETSKETIAHVNYGKDTSFGFQVSDDDNWKKTHTIVLSGLSLGTQYNFKITAMDLLNNVGSSENQTFTTQFLAENMADLQKIDNVEQFQNEIESTIQSILPSLIPPFIDTPTVTDITENSATINFRTNVKSYPIVDYVADSTYDTTKADPDDGEVSDVTKKTIEHTVILNNLKSNTKYHVMTKAFSLPQVVGKSADFTFTTAASKIQASVIGVKKDSFTVVWTTDEPTSSIVEYKDLRTGIVNRVVDSAMSSSHSVNISSLTPGTHYEVNVSGINAGGNTLESGNPVNVTTSIDVTPPVISNLKVDSSLIVGLADKVQTIISWQTDEPATSVVNYAEGSGSPNAPLTNKQEKLEYTLNHVVILTSLKAGTVYRFALESTDGAGNTVRPPTRTIVTPQQTASIMDIIFKNFDDTFKFMNNIK